MIFLDSCALVELILAEKETPASAQTIGPALTAFVTYDKTLSRAAAGAGLPLEQPA